MSIEPEPAEDTLAYWRAPLEFLPHSEKHDRGYLPSYDWGEPTLGDRHQRIAEAVWDVPGWLRREDTMKLYELAYFSTGPILEIGTFCGKSAITMATALADAGRRGPVVTVDVDPSILALARRYIAEHCVQQKVVLVCQSAERLLAAFPTFRPSLVFVDGNHAATAVQADLSSLASCLLSGALVLCHDYLPDDDLPDVSGFPVSPQPIEVREAVARSWLRQHASFAGTFGCSALFRITSMPSRTAPVADPDD